MEELCKKYPALELPVTHIYCCKSFTAFEFKMDVLYKDFKANISCIGLEPEEYETCIKWFCDTMEY